MGKNVSLVLFLGFFVSACTSQESFDYNDSEGWTPDISKPEAEFCDLTTGVTNKGNSCYWIPE
jgi:hypothetical protein